MEKSPVWVSFPLDQIFDFPAFRPLVQNLLDGIFLLLLLSYKGHGISNADKFLRLPTSKDKYKLQRLKYCYIFPHSSQTHHQILVLCPWFFSPRFVSRPCRKLSWVFFQSRVTICVNSGNKFWVPRGPKNTTRNRNHGTWRWLSRHVLFQILNQNPRDLLFQYVTKFPRSKTRTE